MLKTREYFTSLTRLSLPDTDAIDHGINICSKKKGFSWKNNPWDLLLCKKRKRSVEILSKDSWVSRMYRRSKKMARSWCDFWKDDSIFSIFQAHQRRNPFIFRSKINMPIKISNKLNIFNEYYSLSLMHWVELLQCNAV